jgi:hypothetical protein
MGHFGPKLEAERDKTLGQNLRERSQRTSIFHFRLEADSQRVRPSRHTNKHVFHIVSNFSSFQIG